MKRGCDQLPSSQHRHNHHELSISMSPDPSRRGSPGNNRFGARGTLKCLNCRNRKAKCEFTNQEDDCRWCVNRGLTCGEKLLGEKHQIREHRKRLGIGNTPVSVIAAKLELAYPRCTPWEICEMAREILLETGDGPDDLSRDVSISREEMSNTPGISGRQSSKDEPSPQTPTLSTQGQTFLSASQRTPPRSHMAESDSSLLSIDPLPAYDFSVQYSVPLRHQYDERDQSNVFDSSIFTQRIVDSGPWSLQTLWHETY